MMFRILLMDRLQWRFHQETSTLPAHVLVVAKSGTKLKRSESQETLDVPIKPSGIGRIVGKRVSMSYVAWYLSLQLATWLRMEPRSKDSSTSPCPGLRAPGLPRREFTIVTMPRMNSICSPLLEQLGLKLESAKALVNVFVIDQVARPNVAAFPNTVAPGPR